MQPMHHYKVTTQWTGNQGAGTADYRAYDRSHTLSVDHKPDILGSSDPSFRGDNTRHNPEDLLVGALSACHMLWYLHLCAASGVVVTDYADQATGSMEFNPDGSGHFTQVTLHPVVTVSREEMVDKARTLHEEANKKCFIANSVNFPILHQPTVRVGISAL
ncbi:MAG: OsmC family protein [Cytophagales bacterium]|nr:OsmC family protein [Cytophagales bacterium]